LLQNIVDLPNIDSVPGSLSNTGPDVEFLTNRGITVMLDPEEGVSVVYYWNEDVFTLRMKG
jgi:hypothetical protein